MNGAERMLQQPALYEDSMAGGSILQRLLKHVLDGGDGAIARELLQGRSTEAAAAAVQCLTIFLHSHLPIASEGVTCDPKVLNEGLNPSEGGILRWAVRLLCDSAASGVVGGVSGAQLSIVGAYLSAGGEGEDGQHGNVRDELGSARREQARKEAGAAAMERQASSQEPTQRKVVLANSCKGGDLAR